MKFTSEITFEPKDPDKFIRVLKESEYSRSSIRPSKKSNIVIISIKATDLTALKSATNGVFRTIQIFNDTIDLKNG